VDTQIKTRKLLVASSSSSSGVTASKNTCKTQTSSTLVGQVSVGVGGSKGSSSSSSGVTTSKNTSKTQTSSTLVRQVSVGVGGSKGSSSFRTGSIKSSNSQSRRSNPSDKEKYSTGHLAVVRRQQPIVKEDSPKFFRSFKDYRDAIRKEEYNEQESL
jgi:hypothetical protein